MTAQEAYLERMEKRRRKGNHAWIRRNIEADVRKRNNRNSLKGV